MTERQWSKRSFYDVAKIKGGLVDPKSSDFRDHLHVGPENIDGQSGTIIGPLQTAAEIGLISGKFTFKKGDILYSKIRPNLNKVARADCDGLCSADMYVISPANPNVDPGFLYHLLRGEAFYRQAVAGSMRSGMPKVNREDLGLINFSLPDIGEQRRIAKILDAWTFAASTIEHVIAQKEKQRSWIRSNVLTGKKRLPGYSKPWKTIKISEFLTEHKERRSGGEAVYSVSVHEGMVDQISHLGRSFAADDTSNYNRVNPGDIVYTKSPTGDFPLGIIKQSKIGQSVIVSPLYGVFRPATPQLGVIFDELMASPLASQRLLAPVVQKGAKNTIAVSNSDFLKATIALPTDSEEAAELSRMIVGMLKELATLQREKRLLRQQKRGLMQDLLDEATL